MSLNYDLPEDAKMIRDTVRDFAENVIKPKARELDEKEEFSPEINRQIGEMGLFGFMVPEKYGGNGFGYLPYIVAVEEIARVDGSHAVTIAAHNSLGIGPIHYFGSEEQKKKYLPPICSGEKVWGFALTEPNAGSDAGGTQTTAAPDSTGAGWVINGSKIFITNGSSEHSLGCTVQAVTGKRPDGKKEYSCFLIENPTPGFTPKTMKNKMVWRASITSELYFDDCHLPAQSLLGKRGEGFRQMLMTLDRGRLAIAAMGLGCAQGAYEMALKYAKERKQFGKSISTFQANAFKLADMDTQIEAARNMLYKAAWLCDQGRPYQKFAAMSKVYCAEVAHNCCNHAVQIHGAYGLMKEYDIERFYRDQRTLEIGEGTSEICRLVISRYIGCYDVDE